MNWALEGGEKSKKGYGNFSIIASPAFLAFLAFLAMLLGALR